MSIVFSLKIDIFPILKDRFELMLLFNEIVGNAQRSFSFFYIYYNTYTVFLQVF